MNFLKKLGHNLFTSIVVFAISVIGFACSCFLIGTRLQEIPFGFLLSGGIIALMHVISHIFMMIDQRRGTSVFTMIAMALRLFVLLGSLILIFLMYYRWGIQLFNVFVFVGVYTVGIIVLCISFILLKD